MSGVDLNNWQSQLRKGLLDMVILNIVRQRRCHGYEMVKVLKQIKGLRIREGNIYAILARLETEGLLVRREEASQSGPPRKYYEITSKGGSAVSAMNEHWDQMTESIGDIRKGL